MSLGPTEVIIVLLVALIVLGPDKLPKAARQIGKFMAEVKKFSAGVQSQVNEALEIDEEKKPDLEHGPPPPTPNPPNPDTGGFRLIDESAPDKTAEQDKPAGQ